MCVWKYSGVTPFVIIKIFLSILIKYNFFFSVTITDYSYIYFVINYVIPLHVTSYSPWGVTSYM